MSDIEFIRELPEGTKNSLAGHQDELQTLTNELSKIRTELRESLETSIQAANDSIDKNAPEFIKALTQIANRTDRVLKELESINFSKGVDFFSEGADSNPVTETELPSRLLKALDKPLISQVAAGTNDHRGWTVYTAVKLLDDERKVLRGLSDAIKTRHAEATDVDTLYAAAMETLRQRSGA